MTTPPESPPSVSPLPRPEPSVPRALLSVRAALILLLAIFTGIVAGAVAFIAYHDVATAVLWGGGAAGGALVLFNSVLCAA